jgi:hypothetical protein
MCLYLLEKPKYSIIEPCGCKSDVYDNHNSKEFAIISFASNSRGKHLCERHFTELEIARNIDFLEDCQKRLEKQKLKFPERYNDKVS